MRCPCVHILDIASVWTCARNTAQTNVWRVVRRGGVEKRRVVRRGGVEKRHAVRRGGVETRP